MTEDERLEMVEKAERDVRHAQERHAMTYQALRAAQARLDDLLAQAPRAALAPWGEWP